MNSKHPKAVRRRLLSFLYERYQTDPLEMLSPADFLEGGGFERSDLIPNMHYLGDRGLVELMIGYQPPMFAAVRITHQGIDLVENRYRFELEFPAIPDDDEEATSELPVLIERLVEEADCSALGGEERQCLLRDVQFLRDELSRPVGNWRNKVIASLLEWIGENFDNADEALPSLPKIRFAIENWR